jgi:hypothetical protein
VNGFRRREELCGTEGTATISPALQHRDSRPRGRTTDSVRSVAIEVVGRPAPCRQRVSAPHVLVRRRAVVPTSRRLTARTAPSRRQHRRRRRATRTTCVVFAVALLWFGHRSCRSCPHTWSTSMVCNGGQEFAVRIRCDRRFAASQPAPAQQALDGVSALVRRVNSRLESELHDVSPSGTEHRPAAGGPAAVSILRIRRQLITSNR